MFNDLIIKEGTVRNVADAEGNVTGFAFDTHIAYYRGLGLSMIEAPKVTVDGEVIPQEDLRFTLNDRTWTFDELADELDVKWELGQMATITVNKPGGLSAGEHTISVVQVLRVSYMPILTENPFTRTVVIA